MVQYSSARAAITKWHRLSSSTTDIYVLIVLEAKSPVKVSTSLVFTKASLLELQMAIFLWLSHIV